MATLVAGRIVRKLPKSKFTEPNSRVACKLFAVMQQAPGKDALVQSILPFAAARQQIKQSLPLQLCGYRTFICPVTVYFPARYVK